MSLDTYASCLEACNRCADYCDMCSVACLKEDNVKMMGACIRLDMDCAAICRLTAGYLARDSKNIEQICRLCAEICDQCAEECSKHDTEHCQKCAEACKRCAEECRKMGA